MSKSPNLTKAPRLKGNLTKQRMPLDFTIPSLDKNAPNSNDNRNSQSESRNKKRTNSAQKRSLPLASSQINPVKQKQPNVSDNPQGLQGAPIDNQRPETRDRRSQKSRSVVTNPLPALNQEIKSLLNATDE